MPAHTINYIESVALPPLPRGRRDCLGIFRGERGEIRDEYSWEGGAALQVGHNPTVRQRDNHFRFSLNSGMPPAAALLGRYSNRAAV